MPINYKLYVKEHPNMIGERPLRFYKNVTKLHNVKMIKPNYYDDPKPWIENSLGVITITGSSALEAAMLQKPTIVFGHSLFNVISNIKHAKSFDDLRSLFKKIDNKEWEEDNTLDCAAYIKTIKEEGISLNIFPLLEFSSKKLAGEPLSSNEESHLKELIKDLIKFYEKAIEKFTKN